MLSCFVFMLYSFIRVSAQVKTTINSIIMQKKSLT